MKIKKMKNSKSTKKKWELKMKKKAAEFLSNGPLNTVTGFIKQEDERNVIL